MNIKLLFRLNFEAMVRANFQRLGAVRTWPNSPCSPLSLYLKYIPPRHYFKFRPFPEPQIAQFGLQLLLSEAVLPHVFHTGVEAVIKSMSIGV
jgi:hypothetical protein